ncbi:hypothetical protein O1L68_20675 [Streptomyces lydicus]|nr:hypothetical protein [Streptomyces lydicus]
MSPGSRLLRRPAPPSPPARLPVRSGRGCRWCRLARQRIVQRIVELLHRRLERVGVPVRIL